MVQLAWHRGHSQVITLSDKALDIVMCILSGPLHETISVCGIASKYLVHLLRIKTGL